MFEIGNKDIVDGYENRTRANSSSTRRTSDVHLPNAHVLAIGHARTSFIELHTQIAIIEPISIAVPRPVDAKEWLQNVDRYRRTEPPLGREVQAENSHQLALIIEERPSVHVVVDRRTTFDDGTV